VPYEATITVYGAGYCSFLYHIYVFGCFIYTNFIACGFTIWLGPGIPGPWPTGEKVLVCISASTFSAQLIRAAKRMAERLQGEWFAVHVTESRRVRISEAEKDSLANNLRLAEKLGAEIISLTGNDVADEILEIARKHNVSQIIIGKPEHTRFWELIHGSVVDKVIRHSQGISIHVIPGSQQETRQHKTVVPRQSQKFSVLPYLLSGAMIVLMTLLVFPLGSYLGLVNIAMLYLVPVLLSAALWGKLPAVLTAAGGVITFDFFFVPPVFTFTVADIRYLLSFMILMLVGLITGTLSARLKEQVNYSRQRENRISALYALSRDIAAEHQLDVVLKSIADNVASTLEGQVVLLLPDENAKLALQAVSEANDFLDSSELAVAAWVYNRGQKAGKGTETLGSAAALYIPLITEQGTQGVLGICFNSTETQYDPERIRLLDAFCGLAALAINRIKLAEQARESSNHN
jgi:two-component system sensor histidine kinase KdpD